jgi:hypothetical protein
MSTVTIACKVQGGMILQPQSTNFKWPVVVAGPTGHNRGDIELTAGVDADFWAEWSAVYAGNSVVTSGAIAAV